MSRCSPGSGRRPNDFGSSSSGRCQQAGLGLDEQNKKEHEKQKKHAKKNALASCLIG
jgi:hypothetical protein